MSDLNKIFERLESRPETPFAFYKKSKKRTIAYAQLREDIFRLGNWLQNQGVQSGDRIGIIGKNSYEWVVIDLACLSLGCIVLPFEVNQKHESIELVAEYTLRLLFTSKKDMASNHDQGVYQFSEVFEALPASPPTIYQVHQFGPEEIFTVNFTSGTSGKPKAIELKKKSFDHLVNHTQDMYQFNDEDTFLVFLPLNVYLERCYIYAALLIGFKIVLTPLELVFHSIQHDKPTVIIGIPYFFETVHNRFLEKVSEKWYAQFLLKTYLSMNRRGLLSSFKPFKKVWGGHIRYLLTGSAPIKKHVLEFYFQMGVPLYEGYGMNEVGGMIALNSPGKVKLGSVGKVFPEKEVMFDEEGQIIVKSEFHANTRYYKSTPAENESTYLSEGRIATGDLGYIDEEGFLFINGRSNDLIVLSNGQKVHPTHVEALLCADSAIEQAIVFGDDRPFLSAVMVPAKGIDKPEETLANQLKELNKQLPAHEQVLGKIVAKTAFSLENGLITPAIKLNRKGIYEAYRNELEALYQ